MMRYAIKKQVFTLMFVLSAATAVMGQDSLFNSGFDHWHGGYFSPRVGCCGVALATPTNWGIPEQLMAMPTNHFTYKETDTAHIRSGYSSAKLYTNTTTIDSAGDVAGGIAVLVPGTVSCAGIIGYGALGMTGDLYQTIAYSVGQPFTGRPISLNWYMQVEHDVADTMHYAYVFSRWDSINLREDTIAYQSKDIPDGGMPYDQWVFFTDTIHYLSAALPDTLHLIFYGGRNGDSSKVGNITWLDDVSVSYPDTGTNTGIVHLDVDDAISIYPNPASGLLHMYADTYMTGYAMELYDLRGSCVMHSALTGTMSSFSIASLNDGVYLYRILDGNANEVKSGKVMVEK